MDSQDVQDTVESLLANVPSGKGLPIGRLGSENPGVEERRMANPQLYQNSSLSCSKIEQDSQEGENALFNSKLPNVAIKGEKIQHRMMCILKLKGMSNREIAKQMDSSDAWVSNVLRQPWAVEYMTGELAKEGRDSLHELLASSAVDSVYTLISMRDNEDAKPAERIQASNSLLNRYLGNPTQPIAHSGKVDMDNLPDSELAKIALAGVDAQRQ